MIKVKICGITNQDDALWAVEYGADALGFNFYKKSPRAIDPDQVFRILEEIPDSIWRVGVFVNDSYERVRDLSVDLGLTTLQFHGEETPYYCEQFARPYWKVFRPVDARGIELMKKYHCDYYLIDTFIEGQFGGTGQKADWELAREAKKVGPLFLAGGLTPENVAEAIRQVQPEGVDVASGVEQSPGKKDRKKLEEFINRAKGI